MESPPIVVPAPPSLPEQEPVSTTLVSALPMLAGMGSMVMMAGMAGANQSRTLVAAGFFLLSTSAFIGAQVTRQLRQRRRQVTSLRRAFLRQLAEVRTVARAAAHQQRLDQLSTYASAQDWLLSTETPALPVEPGVDTFGSLRLGLGDQPLLSSLVQLPAEDVDRADPAAVKASDDLARAHRHVRDLPQTVQLADLDRITVTGPTARQRAWARAVICSAATRHVGARLRVVLVCSPDELTHWDWLKWLPHHRSDVRRDAAAGVRLVVTAAEEAPPAPASSLTLVVAVGPAVRTTAATPRTTVLHLPLEQSTGHHPGGSPDAPRQMLIRLGDEHDAPHQEDVLVTASGSRPLRADTCAIPVAETVARALDRLASGDRHRSEPRGSARRNDLAELLGVRDLERWEADQTWSRRQAQETLVAPLGLDEDGEPVHLDLKESAHGGSGPHGLVVGATGSGKSELLRTLVAALAMRHAPDELAMVLVDFKGGATFAGFADLPHVSALVTNLGDDHSLVNRMQDALTGEMVRRQELLRASGHASLHDYRSARERGHALPAVPSLFICIDEFSELLSARPDFIEVFVAIGRLGRSLGIHLLLASQRIEEGRLRGLESHLSYRIGLRTFSAAESRAAIGVPDAHSLPQDPGAGLIVTGSAAPRRFTAAYVSGPVRRAVPVTSQVGAPLRLLPWTLLPLPAGHPSTRTTPQPSPAEPGNQTPEPETTVDLVVRAVAGHPRTHAVWLPPLAESPDLSALMPDLATDPERGLVSHAWRSAPGRRLPIGVLDRPKEQRRDTCTLDLSGAVGHLVVVGGPRSGKSTLLSTVVGGLALTTTPSECQLFLLDFAGGALAALAGLPHVVGHAARGDDMVTRVVAQVCDLVARRERYFRDHGIDSWETYVELRSRGAADDGYGEVHVVLDGWGVMRTDHFEFEGALQQVAERGLSFGVHLLVATPRWNDLRASVRDLLGTRVELRLGDPAESVVDRRLAHDVPSTQPGRGLVDGLHLLTARPALGGGDLEGMVTAVAAAWQGPLPSRLRRLPELVELPALLASVPSSGSSLVLGLDGHDLSPALLDPSTHRHLVVRGADRSGRTAVLRAYAREVARTRTPRQAQVVVVDPRGTLEGAVGPDHLLHHLVSRQQTRAAMAELASYLTARLPGPEVSADDLRARSWWSGAEVFVVVDDHDLVTAGGWQESGLHLLAPLLPQAREVGLHVVVAQRAADHLRSHDPLVQSLTDLSVPRLLLPGGAEVVRRDGPVTEPVPGRAQLLTRAEPVRTIQVAWTG